MDLEVELFRKWFIAVRAQKFCNSHMDHLGVLVQVSLLGKSHVAVAAQEGALAGVRPQVVKILAHRKDTELTSLCF